MRLFKLMTSQLSRLLIIVLFFHSTISSALEIGEKAPAFSLFSHTGKKVSLEDFKEKIVVLEWFNKGCPFVKKFYESGYMQKWQKKYATTEIVWLTISSSAEGKQGHETIEEVKATRKKWKINSTLNLLDHSGQTGLAYSAKTTPHFFIIGKQQEILYQGAIDSILSIDSSDIEKADNYVIQALELIKKEKEIKTKKTAPYGCSVKY